MVVKIAEKQKLMNKTDKVIYNLIHWVSLVFAGLFGFVWAKTGSFLYALPFISVSLILLILKYWTYSVYEV